MNKRRIILLKKYIKSLILGTLYQYKYRNIHTFCMFIGYPRSGHSFIGALLDAHPNIVMAMEEDVLELAGKGFMRNQIFYCLENNSRIFTNKLKNIWTGYSYAVPNGYQGKYEKLYIIGDKKGGRSTMHLGANPKLYKKLTRKVGCAIKIIHVIRNPFDDISTMVKRNLPKGSTFRRDIIEHKIKRYLLKAKSNMQHIANPELNIINIYHEDFILNPEKNLQKIINFLNVDSKNSYIENCASITYKKPHYSRFELEWPNDLKELVQKEISQIPFLKHYSFESK